ncbi:hypothetical protein [Kitasatospora sp. NPDC002965]|uniref:hypothetical protein n=1 Tax=Kitasatospora sp. NPDC002965 TaxID=3154775 RepID=UPI0033BC97E5
MLARTRRSRIAHRLKVFLVTALAVAATGIWAQPAAADVRPGQWRYLHTKIIQDAASDISGETEYTNVVTAIRQAAGHPFDGDIREIQDHAGGLIVLEIEGELSQLRGTLLINPQSLYIAGFVTAHNAYFYFRDAAPSVISEIHQLALSQNGRALPLQMNGSWGDWEQRINASGVGLQRNFNTADFGSASWYLWRMTVGAHHDHLPQIAEAMRTLAAAYELGVRWTSFRDDVARAMGRTTYETRTSVYDEGSMEVRRSWARWTNWAARHAEWWRNHRAAEAATRLPENFEIGPINGTLRTMGDIHREIRMTPYLGPSR